ncbi:PREDICTED: uncharacterized protein LOC106744909 [Dinoponera quadriceps]|uniref:Uncharacterized protein LOC106744909 n=1 Tax=Dinoponera quadriceps TaxID=609295 RepID=A0A6P3XCB6_DINQU|nr:PREDICTED: uncharacterized protein LOC106744909 [Dinoponera quadriceps]
MSTEHRLLVMKTRFKTPPSPPHLRFQKIRFSAFREKEVTQNYVKKLEEKLQQTENEEPEGGWNLEQRWRKFKTDILKVAEEVCVRTTVNTRMKQTKLWNEEVKEGVSRKKAAWKEYMSTKRAEDWRNYVEARNEAKQVQQTKESSWQDFGEEIESEYRNNQKKFWKILRFLQVEEEGLEDGEMIMQSEVREDIIEMKMGKAGGWNGISPELMKYGGEVVVKWMIKICQQAWNTQKIPKDWEKNIIIPIHKKGSTLDCANYRAICLSRVAAKVYSRLLQKILRQEIEENLEEEQCAFWPNRQRHDHIFTLRTVIDKRLSSGKDVLAAFIDLKAVFDSVPREQLRAALKEGKSHKDSPTSHSKHFWLGVKRIFSKLLLGLCFPGPWDESEWE